MSAWYMDMCVNAPLPVTSPIAHTPVRRAHPAVGGYGPGRLVQADRGHAERGQVDPAPGGDEQPLGGYGAHAQVDGEVAAVVADPLGRGVWCRP